jgi:hypothetical protein
MSSATAATPRRVGQARWLPFPGTYPRTRAQGLEWWEHRIRRIDRGAGAIRPGRLIEIELGELLISDTSRRQVCRIARLAGVRDELATLKRFARRRMRPGLANEGRWRRGLGQRRQGEIEARYAEILDRLEGDGVSCVPLLRRAYERTDGSG